MKNIIISLIIVLISMPSFAQTENVEVLKQPAKQETSANTTFQDEAVVINNALQVFKNKSKENDKETSVVIENADGSKTLVVGKSFSSSDNTLVFSSDGSKAFYMDTSVSGATVVYGIDFSTSQTYSFGGASSFSLADCPNKGSYVVVTKDGEEDGSYYLYDYDGNSIDAITYTGDIEDINEVICY